MKPMSTYRASFTPGIPGEFGGKAIAEVLFGEVNPSAKLPVTFYRSVDDLPDFEDYNMEAGPINILRVMCFILSVMDYPSPGSDFRT
jgi:hypothetical protein